MRVLHLSDTHLGYAAYARLDENGYNQREVDLFDAFRQAVDMALSLRVDAVLHSGDLFDTIRPSNRAIHFAMSQVLRLSEAGVPFVAISGNHSTPRLRETGSVFRLLEHIEDVHVVYAGAHTRIEVGDAVVHCVPHCPTQDSFAVEVAKVEPIAGRTNVAMLHCGVSGVHRFTTGEFNENVLPGGQLWPAMTYVALGHYHEKTLVAANAVYAGSTERLSFGESGRPKGVVEADLEGPSIAFHELNIRPMVDLGIVDCEGLANPDIVSEVERVVSSAKPQGKILRLSLANLPRSQAEGLDARRLRSAAADAVHFELKVESRDEGVSVQPGTTSFGDMRAEFDEFLAKVPVENVDRAELAKLARGFIASALESREGD
jgi:exonuclease SbcD